MLTVRIDTRLLGIWVIWLLRLVRTGILPLGLIKMIWELRISDNTRVTGWDWERIGINGGMERSRCCRVRSNYDRSARVGRSSRMPYQVDLS